MMGTKKLSEIKAEVRALLKQLPGGSPRAWLEKEIKAARKNPARDVETLEMLCAALERAAPARKRKSRAGTAKR